MHLSSTTDGLHGLHFRSSAGDYNTTLDYVWEPHAMCSSSSVPLSGHCSIGLNCTNEAALRRLGYVCVGGLHMHSARDQFTGCEQVHGWHSWVAFKKTSMDPCLHASCYTLFSDVAKHCMCNMLHTTHKAICNCMARGLA